MVKPRNLLLGAIFVGGLLVSNAANAITKNELKAPLPALSWMGFVCATNQEYQDKNGKCDVKIFSAWDVTKNKKLNDLINKQAVYNYAVRDGPKENYRDYFMEFNIDGKTYFVEAGVEEDKERYLYNNRFRNTLKLNEKVKIKIFSAWDVIKNKKLNDLINKQVVYDYAIKDGPRENYIDYFMEFNIDGKTYFVEAGIRKHITKNGFYYKQLGYGTYSATYYENDKPQVTYTITSAGYDSRRIFKFRPPGGYGYDPAPLGLYQIAIVDKYYCNIINEGEELSYDEILKRARERHCKVLPSEFSCSFKGAIAFCYPFNDRMARVAAEKALHGQY